MPENPLDEAVTNAKILDAGPANNHPRIVRLSTDEVFADLPEHPWRCKGLQIGPGRPTCFAGYSYGGKSLAVQSAALAIATGRDVWGHFKTGKPCRVWHVDQEQGRGTLRRYQRLARGMDISKEELGGRLEVSLFPPFNLVKTPDAVWARECKDVDIVVLDALRGMLPGADENSSEVQDYIAKLTRVSEKTETSFVVIHHAGKGDPRNKDPRELLRGSSGIFSAFGSVFTLVGGKDELKCVSQVKTHPDGLGAALDDFFLDIQDVPCNGDKYDGLHVGYKTKVEASKQTGTCNEKPLTKVS